MSFLESLLEGPVKIADNLFNNGKYPLIIIAIIGIIVYFVFFK